MIIEIGIPDVPVGPIRLGRVLEAVFLGRGPKEYKSVAFLENVVRLTQHAALEYMRGKEAVLRVWASDDKADFNIGSSFQASAHFETCVSDTHRALNHVAAVRIGAHVLPVSQLKLPAILSIYEEGLRRKIREMRNAVQHKEERVLNGQIAKGEPFAVYATGDEIPTADNNSIMTISRIELGPHRIEFATLAKALMELRTWTEILAAIEFESHRDAI